MPIDLSKIPLNEYGHVQTRDGEPARVIYVSDNRDDPYLATRPFKGKDTVDWYFSDGSYQLDGRERHYDLVPVPRKRKLTGWVNVYDGDTLIGLSYHKSREIADSYGSCTRIACLDLSRFGIEFVEGEGLE